MKNVGTKEFETERFFLRKIELDDALEMYNSWCNDSEVTRYLPWDNHESISNTKELLNIWINDYNNLDTYRWMVVDKKNNTLVGTIDVVNIDNTNKVMELGHCYKKSYWGKGVATEVLSGVMKYLFNNTDVDILTCKILETNIASNKVVLKCGFKYDGVLRDRVIDKVTKRRVGQVYYSITREEKDAR